MGVPWMQQLEQVPRDLDAHADADADADGDGKFLTDAVHVIAKLLLL